MKLSDVNELGLLPEALNAAEIDHTELIVSNEFYKRDHDTDYRERAIDALIKMGQDGFDFHSESNIISRIAKRYLRLTCPYCEKVMETHSNGGASCGSISMCSIGFRCDCGARASIELQANAFSFQPPNQ